MSENTTDIEAVSTALTQFDKVAAGIGSLTKQFGGVLFDVQTTKGMTAAKEARAAIRAPRYEIERLRKVAKAPLLAIGKRLDSAAARITGELMAIEDPIDEQIKNEESRKEREKAEATAREAARIAALVRRVDELRNLPVQASGKSSAQIAELLFSAETLVIGPDFEEFQDEAARVHSASVAALRGLKADAEAQEAERARIAAERAELAKLRAEAAEREASERARIAEEERKAREQREAEQRAFVQRRAEEEAAARAAREEADRLAAEERRKADEDAAAERARQQAELDAERQRIAAQRAAHEAEQARLAALAHAQNRPSDDELVDVLAAHYQVDADVVRSWLATYGAQKAA